MTQIVGIGSPVSALLASDHDLFVTEWISNIQAGAKNFGSMADSELKQQCRTFLSLFCQGLDKVGSTNPEDSGWESMRVFLAEISASRTLQGFTPTETATFVFSFKEPLFRRLREELRDGKAWQEQVWGMTELLDGFGLYTTEAVLRTREDLIRRGQEDMLELSTPVVKLWDGILALPLIGTLDSARTQVVMETLLEALVNSNAKVAIIDITGVPTVDTVVAQHLLKTVAAARLMGADCIISGIRPQIAQTIVHLGIKLLDVATKATLRDAFAVALEMTGRQVFRNDGTMANTD